MEESKLKIVTYDLKSTADNKLFLNIRDSFLDILANCYKNRYFGDDIYMSKLSKKEFIILAAFLYYSEDKKTCARELVGTLFYKHTGKLSGMAVSEEFRNLGVAKKLLEQAKKNFSYLFGEVAVTNPKIQRFLTINNFTPIKDKSVIERNLLTEKDKIHFQDEEENFVTYFHSQYKQHRDKHKKFIMLEFKKID